MIKGSTTWYNALTNRLGGNFGLATEIELAAAFGHSSPPERQYLE
jgi:hypothetical protein